MCPGATVIPAMSDLESNVKKFAAIGEMGVKIAVDDFGTGYSSLAYLARLPVHTVKIDRSFVNTMLRESHSMTIVLTIISMAHSMGLTVVAEGVETVPCKIRGHGAATRPKRRVFVSGRSNRTAEPRVETRPPGATRLGLT